MTTTRTPWTPAENQALVALYFSMLDRAIAGESYNKAAMIRHAQGIEMNASEYPAGNNPFAELNARSRGSIEAKLMNASAAHLDLVPGATMTMASHGYKAWGNYQSSLKDAMREGLAARMLPTAKGVA